MDRWSVRDLILTESIDLLRWRIFYQTWTRIEIANDERGDEAYHKIERGRNREQNPVANDKNLYRGIRLGRIVNLNGRVIGSIVKKKRKGAPREYQDDEEGREEKRRNREWKENEVGKMEEIRGWLGCLHNFLS